MHSLVEYFTFQKQHCLTHPAHLYCPGNLIKLILLRHLFIVGLKLNSHKKGDIFQK